MPRLWQQSVDAMLDAAERYARQIVSGWADGVYLGEAVLDDDGFDKTNIVIRARVTKRGSDVTVDLTESDPQVTGFINSSHANTPIGGGDGVCVSARSRHRQERGSLPAADREAEGRNHRVGARGGAGDDVHQSLLERDHRGDHRGLGAGLSGSGDGRLGAPAAHRAERDRPANGTALHLAHVPGAARRRRIGGGGRVFDDRRVALGRRHKVRQHRSRGGPVSAGVRDPRISARIGR